MIRRLLSGLVAPDVLAGVVESPSAYLDMPIDRLGIDSLAVMTLVVRLEEVRGREFDYEAFDLRSISTLRSILALAEEAASDD